MPPRRHKVLAGAMSWSLSAAQAAGPPSKENASHMGLWAGRSWMRTMTPGSKVAARTSSKLGEKRGLSVTQSSTRGRSCRPEAAATNLVGVQHYT